MKLRLARRTGAGGIQKLPFGGGKQLQQLFRLGVQPLAEIRQPGAGLEKAAPARIRSRLNNDLVSLPDYFPAGHPPNGAVNDMAVQPL